MPRRSFAGATKLVPFPPSLSSPLCESSSTIQNSVARPSVRFPSIAEATPVPFVVHPSSFNTNVTKSLLRHRVLNFEGIKFTEL
ncbi:hypothetical protein SESBI_36478 [Sesbania bispinosa]|nr:hypothetical protein SESBI_36478 [Sesbania bispinosa]